MKPFRIYFQSGARFHKYKSRLHPHAYDDFSEALRHIKDLWERESSYFIQYCILDFSANKNGEIVAINFNSDHLKTTHIDKN